MMEGRHVAATPSRINTTSSDSHTATLCVSTCIPTGRSHNRWMLPKLGGIMADNKEGKIRNALQKSLGETSKQLCGYSDFKTETDGSMENARILGNPRRTQTAATLQAQHSRFSWL